MARRQETEFHFSWVDIY